MDTKKCSSSPNRKKARIYLPIVRYGACTWLLRNSLLLAGPDVHIPIPPQITRPPSFAAIFHRCSAQLLKFSHATASMGDVASYLGVTRGAIYYYVPSEGEPAELAKKSAVGSVIKTGAGGMMHSAAQGLYWQPLGKFGQLACHLANCLGNRQEPGVMSVTGSLSTTIPTSIQLAKSWGPTWLFIN